jgi:hypothetical protein
MPASGGPRRNRLLAVTLTAAAAALIGAGCAEGDRGSSGPSDLAGLVVLSDNGETPAITTYDSAGKEHSITTTDHPAVWISAGRGGQLVATLADGSLRLSDRIRSDRTAKWTRVPSPDEQLPEEPLYFAQWAPSGTRFAALATDFGEDGSVSLFIVDPQADTTLTFPLDAKPAPAPPAWIDDARVAVQTTSGIVVAGIDSGDTTKGPETGGGEVQIDAAADGTVVAVGQAEPGRVEIRARDEWLAARGSPQATLEGGGTVGAIALDRRGARLAVIWERADGNADLAIYRRDSGWREAVRVPLPEDAQRGVVSWLP